MADNVDSNSENLEEDGVISLDDLDTLLAEEDPEFSDEMEKISKDDELRNAEVEVVDFEHPEEEAEEAKPGFREKHPKLVKLVTPIFNFISRIKSKISNTINNWQKKFLLSLHWLKTEFPSYAKTQIKNLKLLIQKVATSVKEKKAKYKALPKRTKWGIYSVLLFVLMVVGAVFVSMKKSWVPSLSEPLYNSLEEVADRVMEIPLNQELKSLYRAFPQPEHYVQLAKYVVNLKRTNNYTNPMAAVEFYLELDSTDTAIEIKDREKMIIDTVQRTVEEFTYNELRTKTGVSKMKTAVRYSINNVLNQGRVNKVQLKTFILKP